MYVQVTALQVPINQMPLLRDVLEEKYLPVVRQRPGFRAGYLLEQVDDPNCAQLLLFWENHADVENFNRTGLLQSSLHALSAEVPGVKCYRQGYIVKLAVRAMAPLEVVGG